MNFGQKVIFSVIYCVGLYVVINATGNLMVTGTEKLVKTLKNKSNEK